ncbi:MAG: (E)-4-hydroxy-3-methylbut-2-enyl-diphosphate synthase [Bacteroidales bacterium]|nr:(E)-4-hydroxy-3-methylbut-2-enyl-diphosphate synthase [Bacteroidales bacterium]
MSPDYCKDFLRYARRKTGPVRIGNTLMGGDQPIRIQSMTNTLTSDIQATADQIERIFKAGADFVRITVPAQKDIDCLPQIKAELQERNCQVPIITDIHFNPKLAYLSAAIVEKVRINPGNFVDTKRFKSYTYTDEEYRAELLRLREQFLELITICREHETALRIGTNHGSLSDRIMSRYGDTPEGMAESAMEFLRVCKQEKFSHVVVSMKASNTRVMVYATRILLIKMMDEGMEFPLHLGVTEAGEGEDGRIRSAVGIGTLLADGIGETIRVSLTEDPEAEIPVCQKIVTYISGREGHEDIQGFGEIPINPFSYKRRHSVPTALCGGDQVPVVVAGLKNSSELPEAGWKQRSSGVWEGGDLSPDMVFLAEPGEPGGRNILIPAATANQQISCLSWDEFLKARGENDELSAVRLAAKDLLKEQLEILKNSENVLLILESQNTNRFADLRSAFFRLMNAGCNIPVIIRAAYFEEDKELFQLKASIDLGGLFIDGLGDGLWLENTNAGFHIKDVIETAFGILQASRVRVSKTEYISCPSCGRTLFDLQATTRKIRERTSHLKGLKIGIMGCIVNGPGEMADANYGYVGAGKGKVTLYKEKEVVGKNIPEDEAVDKLIELIKENGDWVDP